MPLPLLALGAVKTLRALPLSVYLALGVAGFIGIREWQHSRTVGRLEKNMAEQASLLKDLRVAVAMEQANTQRLKASLQTQNDAIRQLEAQKKAAETAAQLAAVRSLKAGEARAADLRLPVPVLPTTPVVAPGAAEMNAWLQARFAP